MRKILIASCVLCALSVFAFIVLSYFLGSSEVSVMDERFRAIVGSIDIKDNRNAIAQWIEVNVKSDPRYYTGRNVEFRGFPVQVNKSFDWSVIGVNSNSIPNASIDVVIGMDNEWKRVRFDVGRIGLLVSNNGNNEGDYASYVKYRRDGFAVYLRDD